MLGSSEQPKSLSGETDVPDLAIGSFTWPGAAKLAEECGELVQVLGKLSAYPGCKHPDGSDLRQRLQEEMADVAGAIEFVLLANPELNDALVRRRTQDKLSRFRRWHRAERERKATHAA